MKVSLVPLEHLDRVWPAAAVLLKPAMRLLHGRYDLDDVEQELHEGKLTLWIAFDADGAIFAAALIRIVDYPKRRFARIEALGGKKMNAWADSLLSVVESYARDLRCDGIEGSGRFGWKRVGAARGYKSTAVFLEKDF